VVKPSDQLQLVPGTKSTAPSATVPFSENCLSCACACFCACLTVNRRSTKEGSDTILNKRIDDQLLDGCCRFLGVDEYEDMCVCVCVCVFGACSFCAVVSHDTDTFILGSRPYARYHTFEMILMEMDEMYHVSSCHSDKHRKTDFQI